MRNADFRIGDFPALQVGGGAQGAAGAVGSGRIAAPGGPAMPDAPRFGALYQQLHREVTRYIEQGDGQDALSPEGAWRRQQLQASLQGTTSDVTEGAGRSTWASGGNDVPAATPAQQQAFVDEVMPMAREAASRLGVAPEVLAAQAALETGWGRAPIRRADGTSSHNLFGIKAAGGWTGDMAQAMTTEVEAGVPVARQASFRAYASPAQSFNDLATLIGGHQRYQAAVGTGTDARAYGQALQRGGYASDPAYAEKLARVAARIQGGAQ